MDKRKTGLDDIMEKTKVMKWSWAGHLGRMENDRWTNTIQSGHLEQKSVT